MVINKRKVPLLSSVHCHRNLYTNFVLDGIPCCTENARLLSIRTCRYPNFPFSRFPLYLSTRLSSLKSLTFAATMPIGLNALIELRFETAYE